MLDEWGTSGKVRPKVETLLNILIKAQFYRAAEYVAVDLLNGIHFDVVLILALLNLNKNYF